MYTVDIRQYLIPHSAVFIQSQKYKIASTEFLL